MVCSPYLALRVMGATGYLAIVDSPIGASSVHCPLVLSAGSALCVHAIPYQYPLFGTPPPPEGDPAFLLFIRLGLFGLTTARALRVQVASSCIRSAARAPT